MIPYLQAMELAFPAKSPKLLRQKIRILENFYAEIESFASTIP